jgi:hypothetical protein
MRRILGLLIVLFALAAVVAATRARHLGARIDAMEIHPGESVVATQHLGDDLPPAPQRVAVIEDVRGDDAALEDELSTLRALGGADVVVLLGNVLREGTDEEARRIVATCRDREFDVIAVPGPGDLAPNVRPVFARWIGPELWWFVHKGFAYVGVPGRGREDDDFARGAIASAPAGSHSILFSFGPTKDVAAGKTFTPIGNPPTGSGVTVHSFDANGKHGGVRSRGSDGRMLATPRSVWRRVALNGLDPLVRGTTGYVAWLAVCAIVAAMGLVMTRKRGKKPE